MRTRKTLEERTFKRWQDTDGELLTAEYIRAELDRLTRRVRAIRQEVRQPTCDMNVGYKTALTDVLALIKELKK